jgi:hypothetical protein
MCLVRSGLQEEQEEISARKMENGIHHFIKSLLKFLGYWNTQTLGSEIQILSGACPFIVLFPYSFQRRGKRHISSIICVGEK